MFMIIIHVFQMDINCVLMKYYLMFMIIIHVFQMDINCILMKYYFHVHDHDCCIFYIFLVIASYIEDHSLIPDFFFHESLG